MYKWHKTKTNSFDSPFRYDKLIMCIYILCNVWLKIEKYILRRSNLKNPTSEEASFGCQIFNIRRTAERMSKIRHPKKRASDEKYSEKTFFTIEMYFYFSWTLKVKSKHERGYKFKASEIIKFCIFFNFDHQNIKATT